MLRLNFAGRQATPWRYGHARRFGRMCVSALLLASLFSAAQANVVLDTTRVIYTADDSSVVIGVANKGERPALIQSWVDAGDVRTTPEDSDAPFVVLPPIARIDPGASQALRLRFTGAPASVPADAESVYWLNVLDVPPAVDKDSPAEGHNYLQFAVRSRIKLFYRPKGLSGNPNTAPDRLRWHVETARDGGAVLVVDNPTAYHVTLTRVAIGENGADQEPSSTMLAPGARFRWPLETDPARVSDQVVHVTAIDDFGASRRFTTPITSVDP